MRNALKSIFKVVVGLGLLRSAEAADLQILSVQSAAGSKIGVPVRGGLATAFVRGLDDLPKLSVAGQSPLPLQLAGVQIFVRGMPAPLLAVINPGPIQQINFQIPTDPVFGDCKNGPPVPVALELAGRRVSVDFPANNPNTGEIFEISGHGAFFHADFSIISAARPASPGETIVILATGLGPTLPAVPAGATAPSAEPLARVTPEVLCGIVVVDKYFVAFTDSANPGSSSVEPEYVGLMPGFVGVFQINVTIPTSLRFIRGPVSVQILRAYYLPGTPARSGNYYSAPRILPWTF